MTRPAVQQAATDVSGENAVYRLDRSVQRVLRDSTLQQSTTLFAVGRAGNWWGGDGVIWFSVLLWLGARALRRTRIAELGLRCVEAIAISSAISGIVKGLAGRSRPFLAPQEPWHWSFAHGWTDARFFSMPSGHTTATFAFAVAIALNANAARPARLATTLLACASALLVAFARVYTDQHWLSDVAAAALLGSATGFLLIRWHRKHPGTRFDRALIGTTGGAA